MACNAVTTSQQLPLQSAREGAGRKTRVTMAQHAAHWPAPADAQAVGLPTLVSAVWLTRQKTHVGALQLGSQVRLHLGRRRAARLQRRHVRPAAGVPVACVVLHLQASQQGRWIISYSYFPASTASSRMLAARTRSCRRGSNCTLGIHRRCLHVQNVPLGNRHSRRSRGGRGSACCQPAAAAVVRAGRAGAGVRTSLQMYQARISLMHEKD